MEPDKPLRLRPYMTTSGLISVEVADHDYDLVTAPEDCAQVVDLLALVKDMLADIEDAPDTADEQMLARLKAVLLACIEEVNKVGSNSDGDTEA